VSSTFLDESVFFALSKSWLGSWVLAEYGYSFTAGALKTMDWLENNVEEITHDSKSDFVIAHLEIPHPPFFLDADCLLDTGPDRSGVTLQWPGVDLDDRKEAYLAQAECVNRFLQRLNMRANQDSIILAMGDHGSDSHHQLALHPRDWTEDAMRERLNVMFAYRGLAGCNIQEPVFLPNVLRDLFECLEAPGIPSVEPRMYRYSALSFEGEPSPIVGLSPSEVRGFLGLRADS
jgi:hypothetical protein